MTGYYTLTEVAKSWNLSTRMLNNYCKDGRIEGAEKVGSIWLIPINAEKPSDKRIKSGNYVNWILAELRAAVLNSCSIIRIVTR